MAELNLPVYDFRHGILTPKLKDRPNLDLYKSGVLVGENFLTKLHGPTEYRPGFRHSRTTRRNNVAHFIPFTFSDDEANILSFTEGFMRIFTDGEGDTPGVVLEDPFSISAITQADPAVLTAVGHDFVNGDEVFIDDAVGMTDLNGQFFLVTGVVAPGTSEMNWPFSVPANFTFDSGTVEVSAGVAKLKQLGGDITFPFTVAGNYTFDSDWVNVTGGEAVLTGLGLPAYAHWKLNASSGTLVLDDSINGRDGTATNMEDGDWVAAKINNGLLFDGVDEFVNFGNIANFERTDTFSIEFWFNTVTAGAEMIMSRQLNTGPTFRGWNVFIEAGVITTALISDNSVVNRIQRKTNSTFNDGLWHHCAVTYSGTSAVSGLIIYIDGSAVATTIVTDNLSATILNAADCQLSGRDGANVVYTGTADEVAIHAVVLSAADVIARFNSGTGTELMQYNYAKPIFNNTGFVFSSALNVFTETATKPGGDDIQYQISSDDGVTWKYWNGAAWVAITGAQTDTFYFDNESNLATVVNTNIGALAASGTFRFRAFLHSDLGTTTPSLDLLEVSNSAFSLTDPTIESNIGFPFTAVLEDFTEIAVTPGTTSLQYIVSIDDGVTFLWWNGAAWVVADGTFGESNPATVVDTNIAALGASGTFQFKAFLHSADITETPELDNIHTQFTVLPSDTFQITDQDGTDIDSTTFEAYIGSGIVSRVFEINSPYFEEDLKTLKFAQKADVMYIDHPKYAPRKLIRFGDGTWTLAPYTRTSDPFGQVDITNITQANPGVVTTADPHEFLDNDVVLIENVSGMTEVNHLTFTVTVVNPTQFSIGVDTSAFTLYDSGGVVLLDGAAPAAVGFYAGRLFHGGSRNDPDFLFGSKSPDPTTGATRYEDFTTGTSPDDAVAFPLTSASTSSVDRTRFFMGTRQFLAVGTFAGMLKVNGGADITPISGTQIESFPIDNFGVADQMPVNFGTDIIYVQRGEEVVYSFKYTLFKDGYESEDETLQSDEVTIGGIKQLAYQQGNPNQVWAAMNDGRLLSFVYSDTESVSAWNEHLMGGDGIVLTVAAQPQADNRDRVWVVVERVIDGVTRRYVEYLAKNPRIPERTDFYTGTDRAAEEADDSKYRNLMFFAQKRQIHLDSCLILDTTQTTTITPAAITGDEVSFVAGESIFSADDLLRRIQVKYLTGLEQGIAQIVEFVSETEVKCKILQDFLTTDPLVSGEWYFTQDTVEGLGHLEGKVVTPIADGGIHPERTVVNGAITLAGQATFVLIGLFYFGRVQTMPLELLLSTGITPGKFKTINKVKLMFRNTLGVSYGTNPYDMQQIAFRSGVQFTDRPPLLFNGVKEQPGFDNYEHQRTMWVIQTVPYPCTLNSMILDMEFSEES